MDPDTFFWGYLSVVGFSIHTAIWYVTTAARILGCTDRSSVRHSVSPSFSHSVSQSLSSQSFQSVRRHSFGQSFQSVTQSVSQSLSHSVSQSVSQSFSQSISQSRFTYEARPAPQCGSSSTTSSTTSYQQLFDSHKRVIWLPAAASSRPGQRLLRSRSTTCRSTASRLVDRCHMRLTTSHAPIEI
jgi:hypothetical protein